MSFGVSGRGGGVGLVTYGSLALALSILGGESGSCMQSSNVGGIQGELLPLVVTDGPRGNGAAAAMIIGRPPVGVLPCACTLGDDDLLPRDKVVVSVSRVITG